MAATMLWDGSLVFDGVDLSSFIRGVEVPRSVAELDDGTMGDDAESVQGGLKQWTCNVTFLQDYASGAVDATLFSRVGTTATLVLKPGSGAVSPTNPSYTGPATLVSIPPITGSHGQLQEPQAVFRNAGSDLARATS